MEIRRTRLSLSQQVDYSEVIIRLLLQLKVVVCLVEVNSNKTQAGFLEEANNKQEHHLQVEDYLEGTISKSQLEVVFLVSHNNSNNPNNRLVASLNKTI